jgi:hypothetical protein
MLGYIIDYEFSNPDLPDGRLYNERLANKMLMWGSPADERITAVDGRVSQLTDRSDAGNNLTQSTAGNRPALEISGGPNSRPCFLYERARADVLFAGNIMPVGPTAKWTKVAVIKSPAETVSNQYDDIMSGSVSSSTTIGLHRLAIRGVNSIFHRVGYNNAFAAVSVPLVPDTWLLVLASWDGSLNRAAISVNGGPWTVSTVAGAACTDADLRVGRCAAGFGFTGRMGTVGLVPEDLSSSSSAATYETVKQHVRDRYGLAIS